jgi:hypothetical protein
MPEEDENILEVYRKKVAEEYKVEDTELTQWEREADVDDINELEDCCRLFESRRIYLQ